MHDLSLLPHSHRKQQYFVKLLKSDKMAVFFKSPQMCHCYFLYFTKLRIFFVVSFVPFLWTARATGIKGSNLPLCNNTEFQATHRRFYEYHQSSGLLLMFIAAVRYATFLQTLSLSCFMNNGPKYFWLD
jgi:hypothetical protein